MILVDTNVLSELMRPRPAERVVRWVAGRPATSLFTTSISQAEILHGVLRLPAGRRREALLRAARATFDVDFAGRVLPFDSDAAVCYAEITAERQRIGRPMSTLDAQIAAIAGSRGAGLATRNVGDFEHCGITIIDPWA